MSSHRTRGHQAGDQQVADGRCPPMEEAGGTPPPRSEKGTSRLAPYKAGPTGTS